MALRGTHIGFLVLALVVCASLITFLFYHSMPTFIWNMRYNDTLQTNKQVIDIYAGAKWIGDVANKCSLQKWYVWDSAADSQRSTTYVGILKFCSAGGEKKEERIIAWIGEEGRVERYIWGGRYPKAAHKGRLAVSLPVDREAFERMVASLGLNKCCHAALLDIEDRKYGIISYHENSYFYYECEINADFWFYWETDREGNILARGVHDSP